MTDDLALLSPDVQAALDGFFAARPDLLGLRADLVRVYRILAQSLAGGGTIFLCGNGGSFADALHISGELLKSYERPRPLAEGLLRRLHAAGDDGHTLAAHLQRGLRAVVLGANVALASAVQNDFGEPRLAYAQELLALARAGDALIAISTSGNAANVIFAAQTARALDLPVIAFTGREGGRLAPLADAALRAPCSGARAVQEVHQPLYHTLCALLELHFFA